MNKIVREHYPVSKLPEDLRNEFDGFETVKIVGDPKEQARSDRDKEFWSTPISELKPRSREQIKADFESYLAEGHPNVTPAEAVARIRALRDEWDDE